VSTRHKKMGTGDDVIKQVKREINSLKSCLNRIKKGQKDLHEALSRQEIPKDDRWQNLVTVSGREDHISFK